MSVHDRSDGIDLLRSKLRGAKTADATASSIAAVYIGWQLINCFWRKTREAAIAHVLTSNTIVHGNWFHDAEIVPPTTNSTPPSPAIEAFLARHGVSPKNPATNGVAAATAAGRPDERCGEAHALRRYGRTMRMIPRVALASHSLLAGNGRRRTAAVMARRTALSARVIAVKVSWEGGSGSCCWAIHMLPHMRLIVRKAAVRFGFMNKDRVSSCRF